MSDVFVNFESTNKIAVGQAKNQHEDAAPISVPYTVELELMQRLAAGQESAMHQLLEQHGDMLSRLIGRLTAWSDDRDDVLQEVLLSIWKKAKAYRGKGALEGWLRKLATNQCYNHLRRQKSLQNLLVVFFDSKKNSENELYSQTQKTNEPSTAMQEALKQLSVNERSVIVLFYLEEMTGDEVAETLGIKIDAVHVRLHRARKKLKSLLTQAG